MLTVAELHRQKEARASVNHETYKQLLRVAQGHIRARAQNRGTSLAWQVPPLVPGRPVFTVAHAARYVSEKLRRGGFEVTVEAPHADVHFLHIDWKQAPPRRQPRPRREPTEPPPPRDALQDATRTLEKLKARLRVG